MSAPHESPFAEVLQAPPDPILGLTEAFLADPNPSKVNLGVGVYQDASGKVPVLRAIREAERRWYETEDSKSYLPIDGAPAYNRAVQALLFGSGSPVLAEGRAVTVQALGGTGALRVGADFLRQVVGTRQIAISAPSWENHLGIFTAAGFETLKYAYYEPESRGLDYSGMVASLQSLPAETAVVLHACCHNPTGVDLSPAQWEEIASICEQGGLAPFIDFAYQGFGDGLEEDAFAVRAFAERGIPCLVSSSFSKSLSIYRERVGALTAITASAEESKRVLSQLKRVIRTNYSNPSSHGAQVAALVLQDEELRALWTTELGEMRERIKSVRRRLVEGLASRGVKLDFSFIERQRGMFSYSGLSPAAVRRLRSERSVYVVDSGRVCVAAVNDRNLDTVCDALASVL